MKDLPANVVAYHRTADFSESTIPAGLRAAHTTKAGVWARICVVRGQLCYRILEPVLEEHLLSPGQDGIVEPGVRHEVDPRGEVRFYVEFLRARS